MKTKTAYVCSACGYDSPKWIGRCPSCGEWNTFAEVKVSPTSASLRGSDTIQRVSSSLTGKDGAGLIHLCEIPTDEEPRINMLDCELNRVLGGGLVPGSLTLLGGEPGIGKSTLILQTVLNLPNTKVLYVSGEESARQIKLRADRLKADSQSDVNILCEVMIETILTHHPLSPHPLLPLFGPSQTPL